MDERYNVERKFLEKEIWEYFLQVFSFKNRSVIESNTFSTNNDTWDSSHLALLGSIFFEALYKEKFATRDNYLLQLAKKQRWAFLGFLTRKNGIKIQETSLLGYKVEPLFMLFLWQGIHT